VMRGAVEGDQSSQASSLYRRDVCERSSARLGVFVQAAVARASLFSRDRNSKRSACRDSGSRAMACEAASRGSGDGGDTHDCRRRHNRRSEPAWTRYHRAR